jgi:hypothetical protein
MVLRDNLEVPDGEGVDSGKGYFASSEIVLIIVNARYLRTSGTNFCSTVVDARLPKMLSGELLTVVCSVAKIRGTSHSYDKEYSLHNLDDVKPMQMLDGRFSMQIVPEYGRTIEMAYRCVDKV